MAAQDQNPKPSNSQYQLDDLKNGSQPKTSLTVEEIYTPSKPTNQIQKPAELAGLSQEVVEVPQAEAEKTVKEEIIQNQPFPPESFPQPTPVEKQETEPPPIKPVEPEDHFSLSPEPKAKAGRRVKIFLWLLFLLVLLGGIYFLYRFIKRQKPGLLAEKTLVYWGLWEDEAIFADLITDWEKTHSNIRINYQLQAKEEYRERLQSALARGEGPDIFRFHNSWLPMFQEELSSLPASVMTTTQFEETFYPVATKDLKIGANVYGLPLEIDTLALFYNESIFEAGGKEPPTDWDQLRRLASELTVRSTNGQIQIAGIAMGGIGNVDHWSDILGLMMLQNGVDLSKPKGKLAEDALIFYTYFLKRDQAWDVNFPNSTLAFANGKLAMYFGFSWDVFEILRVNKDLKFKIIPVPQLKERKAVAWASYWVEGVSKRTKNQNEAWEFLKYLVDKETLRKLYLAQSQTRLFGEPYSRVDLASEIKEDPLVGPFITQAPLAQSGYLCSRTFDNGLNSLMIKYFEDAINGVNQGKTATQVLETVAQGVKQVFSRYRISP